LRQHNRETANPSAPPTWESIQGAPGEQGIQGLQGIQGPPGPVNIPEVTIIPAVSRYFTIAGSDLDLDNLQIIPANQFTDDNGKPATGLMSLGPNGYFNVYINGMLQEGGLFDVTPDSLVILPAGGVIYQGSPIILEMVRFSVQITSIA
jgi:hypothetical protein